MYEFFIGLLVESDEHPDGSTEEFVVELTDAEDEEAICGADNLLDRGAGVQPAPPERARCDESSRCYTAAWGCNGVPIRTGNERDDHWRADHGVR
jgi:hypothetical protein